MYTITLRFRDENMPIKVREEKTLNAAMTGAMAALRNYAALHSVAIDDSAKRERHIFSPSDGYLFTIPTEGL